ncbi:class I adenylate-forming enzyme family protein [Halalkalibacter okhensis]|uniref:O-succinylbenzoate--CoA ligase n=1 Tax=Halalkalibacter okhensis TaxID=333138 RepID=A0A0B0IM26_9BACI|nr:long-chain-fatty-acid--CoA ligase [Halalkalibacter okhensis]KHF41897.1 O-succinylbenzoate--CoA ligase [Halalkalibacter okhensis]
MNVSELLARNARKYSDHTALLYLGEEMSYRTLDERVTKLASSLRDRGITKGDKVILFFPNVPEFAISYFAVLRLGAITVPVNARLTPHELSYIIEHSEAKAFIGHEMLFETCKDLSSKFQLHWIKTGDRFGHWDSFEDLLTYGSSDVIHCDLKEDELATILYTSGTTGKPKGVLFSYRNILSVATMMAVETEMKSESRMLHIMPLSHSAPLHLFFVAGTYVGATHILHPSFTPEALLELVEQQKPTHFFGAPVAYLLTASHPKLKSTDLSSMKWWIYGGAPLSKNEITYIRNSFRTNQLMCVYGLTEAGPSGTLLCPSEHDAKAGSIGRRAALNTELAIINENGDRVDQGEIGEIALFGEGNMVGYYKDDIKTKETVCNGWLLTGDMAREDEDGYIWIVDRKKDMIICGGINVYPKEIEDALKEYSAITDVAVIGVPHSKWGESIKAYIVTNDPIENPLEICQTFLEGRIAKYKIPHIVECVDDLPRNPTGKILKQVLRGKEGALK